MPGAQSFYRSMLLDCTRVTEEMTIADRLAFGSFMAEEQQRMLVQLPEAPQVAILAESLQELLSWLGV